MGLANGKEDTWEQPSEKHVATLYYFAGRGLADQIRWMLAATEVPFTQKIINHRDQLLKMSQSQLPFGQLPLLQIDGLELVQSQAIVRYLARRAGLQGLNADEVVKCDMIAEAVRDLLGLATSAPFKRTYLAAENGISNSSIPVTAQAASSNSVEDSSVHSTNTTNSMVLVPSLNHDIASVEWQDHVTAMKTKFAFIGGRFEAILRSNRANLIAAGILPPASSSSSASGKSNTGAISSPRNDTGNHSNGNQTQPRTVYLVGNALTYADILVTHVVTWFVEECGRYFSSFYVYACDVKPLTS